MAPFIPSLDLLPRVFAGELRAMARLMTRAEGGEAECREALARVYEKAGRAHVVGITGVPGSGKSTLVTVLARQLRAAGHKVGIIAVDPSSPYTGGSIMGDRIRMTELASDDGVFIRSMATRGAQGGMARATLDTVDILDVAGFGRILIETVGVGQDEVEIARASHTTLVVSAPGLGDEIQAIKAGVLEIADIHVVSKADRSDANRTLADLKSMLRLGMTAEKRALWQPPIVATSSLNGTGFTELISSMENHKNYLSNSEIGRARAMQIAEFRMLKTAEELLRRRFLENRASRIAGVTERVADRRLSPYAAAEELLEGTTILAA